MHKLLKFELFEILKLFNLISLSTKFFFFTLEVVLVLVVSFRNNCLFSGVGGHHLLMQQKKIVVLYDWLMLEWALKYFLKYS